MNHPSLGLPFPPPPPVPSHPFPSLFSKSMVLRKVGRGQCTPIPGKVLKNSKKRHNARMNSIRSTWYFGPSHNLLMLFGSRGAKRQLLCGRRLILFSNPWQHITASVTSWLMVPLNHLGAWCIILFVSAYV